MFRLVLPAFAFVFLAGCQSSAGRSAVGTIKMADGVPIAYESHGNGDTSLVFVHCWCCDRTFWHNQMDEFAQEYRVVAVDLAGHGASGRNRETWTIPSLAEDVAAVIEKLDLRRVVLIGHSMGGPVSLEVARLMPGRVMGIVAVDTLHDVEMEYPADLIEHIAGRLETNFEGTLDDMVTGMFPADADGETVQFVLAEAKSCDPKIAAALIRNFSKQDNKAAFTAARVPIRAINAVPHPPNGMKTAIEVNRQYADFDAVFLDGVGHYLQLEKPAEFNELLREILHKMIVD